MGAFFCSLFKASNIVYKKEHLELDKKDAVRLQNGEISQIIPTRPQHFWVDFKTYLTSCTCLPCWENFNWIEYLAGDNRETYMSLYRLSRSGTYENFVLRSFLGFLCGVILTYMAFVYWFVATSRRHDNLPPAPIMFLLLASVLTIGMAFSSKFRCFMCLLLPVIFSKTGQKAVIGYAVVLAMTGPAKNTVNNTIIMWESVACIQEQLYDIFSKVLECIKNPLYCARQYIEGMMKNSSGFRQRITKFVMYFGRYCIIIVDNIRNALRVITNYLQICQENMGTLYEQCKRNLLSTSTDCYAKLGPYFKWLCQPGIKLNKICSLASPLDTVCEIVSYKGNDIIKYVKYRLKRALNEIKAVLWVRIKYKYDYIHNITWSTPLKKAYENMSKDAKVRFQRAITYFDYLGFIAATFCFASVVFQVVQYHIKYLTSSRFDNKYITQQFLKLDMERVDQGFEPLLPFTKKEESIYTYLNSRTLASSEKKALVSNCVTVATKTLEITLYMLADFSLYYVLDLVNRKCKITTIHFGTSLPKLILTSQGLISSLLSQMLKVIQPDLKVQLNIIKCIPTPMEPDYMSYFYIYILILIAWILALIEPYGLRFRCIVMSYYYPRKSRERAIWLYHHILHRRSTFLKLARRELRRKAKNEGVDVSLTKLKEIEDKEAGEEKSEQLSEVGYGFCYYKRIIYLFKSFYGLYRHPKFYKTCLLCGLKLETNSEKDFRFFKCQSFGCIGLYCEACFISIKYVCPICLVPSQYGDMSDMSEEKDSSDDEEMAKKKKEARRSLSLVIGEYQHLDDVDEDIFIPSTDSELSTSYQYEKSITVMHRGSSIEPVRNVSIDKIRNNENILDVSSETSIEDADIILGSATTIRYRSDRSSPSDDFIKQLAASTLPESQSTDESEYNTVLDNTQIGKKRKKTKNILLKKTKEIFTSEEEEYTIFDKRRRRPKKKITKRKPEEENNQ